MIAQGEKRDQPIVHTPGPWTVAKNGRSVIAGSQKINQSSGPMAATCSVSERHNAEVAANPRLIAAAPELLSALKEILEWIANGYDPSIYDIEEAARAVQKAETGA